MAAKVVWYRDAWWVRVHHRGRKKDRRVGTTKADKKQAQEIAKKVNAAIALGTFTAQDEAQKPLPCDAELRRWHTTYSPTFKLTFEAESRRVIEKHLIPAFGSMDLRKIREEHVLGYIREKLDAGLVPLTIQTHLSILRRVLSLAVRAGDIPRNPAARLGELLLEVLATRRREVLAKGLETVPAWVFPSETGGGCIRPTSSAPGDESSAEPRSWG